MSVIARIQQHKAPIDLEKHELRNPRLQQLGADPADPVEGMFFERSDTHKWRAYLNGAWVDLATMADVTAGGLSVAIMDAKGDLIVGTGADEAARKAAGADGTALFSTPATADGLTWRGITQADVDGLSAALSGKADDADITALDGRLDTAEATLGGLGTAAGADVGDFDAAGAAAAAQAFAIQRGNHTGAQAISTVTGLQAALDAKVDDSQIGAANGVASLDGGGKVPAAQLPALAISEVTAGVADIAARDALDAQSGDVAILVNGDRYIYDGTTWHDLDAPGDFITAVTAGTGLSSTGGTAPELSIAAGGVGTTQLADEAVTAAKLGAVAGTGLTGGAGSALAIDTTVVARKVEGTLGDGAATSFVLNHPFNTRGAQVSVWRNSAPWDEVELDVMKTSTGSVTVQFTGLTPAADEFAYSIVG